MGPMYAMTPPVPYSGDGYVPLDDGLCKNIHNLDVFYHQIEGFFPNN